ncbi:hypothetical protein [Nocardia jejuensis]|uniref:hypothetical protein n=1 Tax=Nocardia jejuensis TaxID=328049 RepID=UPI000AADF110|nr:hypothetical protein [Nocardia jejuensis]
MWPCNRPGARLVLPESNSAIVALEVSPEVITRLQAVKVIGAIRAGRLRLACHLYNTEGDIEQALGALARA